MNSTQQSPGILGTAPGQRGAVLIISLIFLLLMTIIGVTSMQTTSMQERMAGNTRDMNFAFQAGELALRQAENNLNTADFRTADLGAPLLDPLAWDTTTHPPISITLPSDAVDDLADPPALYVAPSTLVIHGITATSMTSEKFYPITTRAVGRRDTTAVVLQSTVKVIE